MALSEFEHARVERMMNDYIERIRPPEHVRPQLDMAYKIEDQSVIILEIRPAWDNPKEKIEGPVAKTIYVKSSNKWNIYWMRADSKWHKYEPCSSARYLEAFLALVEEDEYGCFWG